VNWRVEDPAKAALMAADTMQKGESVVPDVLKRDVLKQALASLAAAMGTVRYSDDTHVAASDKLQNLDCADKGMPSPSPEEDVFGNAQIFSVNQMSTAVRHANEICSQYGVRVVSINVISAFPTDPQLQKMLGAGAIASAAALQAEMAARGNAKAKLIASQSEAEAMRIAAHATADAERLKAQGKKDAAALLEVSEVAVDLAKIERTGDVIGDKTTFFFGDGLNAIPKILSKL
jgi:regulator of protease activity HflC (stomatin/prohibitin superfamily)